MAKGDVKDLTGMELAMLETAFGFSKGPKLTKDKGDGSEREEYRALVHNGIAFTLPEKAYKVWEAGEGHTMRIIESTRKIVDPADPAKEVEVPSWEFVNVVSHTTYDNFRNAQVKDQFRAEFIKQDIQAKAAGLNLAAAKS